MWSPMYQEVSAMSQEEAMDKLDDNSWEAPFYPGEEKYDIEIVAIKEREE